MEKVRDITAVEVNQQNKTVYLYRGAKLERERHVPDMDYFRTSPVLKVESIKNEIGQSVFIKFAEPAECLIDPLGEVMCTKKGYKEYEF